MLSRYSNVERAGQHCGSKKPRGDAAKTLKSILCPKTAVMM
jgi:hypothetical protein